ncbi:tRNA A64-2'-O-ribosylphosphate transferase isoform X2 [Malania oleifera]|nr:tRNA A64-2'-O-ribosylphosphate transferase isoform X2 [Malania oleifera]
MSKTIPIWACVLNRAIANYSNRMRKNGTVLVGELYTSNQDAKTSVHMSYDWDCSLHLPLWVSKTEKAAIEDCLEKWTKQLEASGADIASLALLLKKPLCPLWISQRTVIWLNEVPDYDSWDFTPIILVSASSSNGIVQHRTTSEFSWNYISGAGDDEESWARGLSPNLFWNHAFDLIASGPDLCNQKVADIVEKDRVYHAQRGQNAPQVSVRPSKLLGTTSQLSVEEQRQHFGISNIRTDAKSFIEDAAIYWLGSTNLAVGSTGVAANVTNVDCILNCDRELVQTCLSNADTHLHLLIVTSKFDRFSLLSNLPAALDFARLNLSKGKRLLVCCHNGEDISVCVCLAIFTSLFNDGGTFDDGKSFNETCITKWEMRRRLVFICRYAIKARPSRGNLKQVFSFLSGGRASSVL